MSPRFINLLAGLTVIMAVSITVAMISISSNCARSTRWVGVDAFVCDVARAFVSVAAPSSRP